MNKKSETFLRAHLPDTLMVTELNDVLDMIYDLIKEKGFAPPHFDEYNDFGREAQRVYDDLYLSNAKKNKQNC